MNNLVAVAEQFRTSGNIIDIKEFGNGNINKTFLVTLNAKEKNHFILQRINTHVFHQPELVMFNMRISTEHMRRRLQHFPLGTGRRWEVLHVLLTQEGQDHWIDSEGSFWRAISLIDNAQTVDTVKDIRHAREAGYALGLFHSLLSDLSPDNLTDTLEGFHMAPHYLEHYNEVLVKHGAGKSSDVVYGLQFVKERSSWANVLETARAQGKLHLRAIHGDPKVNNIMMDTASGQAVSFIDLDTIKPGLVHYDIGDCLRSGCNPPGEETKKLETVYFDTDLCRAILQGYLSMANEFLTANDFEYLYDSIRLLTFELGLRFFTDYLEGNVYFKVRYPEHNLDRALVQFRLTGSIESQEAVIRNIIKGLR